LDITVKNQLVMKKTVKTFLIGIISLVSVLSTGYAQESFLRKYLHEYPKSNPALAGQAGTHHATAMLIFWPVFDNGNPYSELMSYDTHISKINSGLGAFVEVEHIGLESNVLAGLSYAYGIEVFNRGKINIGLQIDIQSTQIDGSQLVPLDPDAYDSFIPREKIAATASDLGFGLQYSEKSLDVGLSPNEHNSKASSISILLY